MSVKNLPLLLFFVICFLSCHPTKDKLPGGKVEDYNPAMKKIIRSDSGVFRQVNLNMSLAAVKALEKNLKPDEEEDNYLAYSFAFSDTLVGNYYYDFDEGLDEVGIDIFREKSTDCDWLFASFKNYYTKRYGIPHEENNMLIWSVPNQGKEGAEITLQDESRDYGYGKLTITIFPFQSEVDPRQKEENP
jgi:hypothetical protein